LIRYKDGLFAAYSTKNGLSDDRVSSICEDREGNLWVGTYGGLNRFKDETFTIEKSLSGNRIMTIHEDRVGNLWINTNVGLVRYKGGKLTAYAMRLKFLHKSSPRSGRENVA